MAGTAARRRTEQHRHLNLLAAFSDATTSVGGTTLPPSPTSSERELLASVAGRMVGGRLLPDFSVRSEEMKSLLERLVERLRDGSSR